VLKFKIAVDVDGVLADHVSPILHRLNSKYGTKLTKEDIIDWNYPIDDTTIDVELEKALFDKDYILKMPVIDGAKDGMLYLCQNHFVLVATSRPKEVEDLTFAWVSSNFKFHDFCNTYGKSKSCLNVDLLIDDNLQNIKDFASSAGVGLLFSQPWNQERSSIEYLIDVKKVYCCDGWEGIVNTIKKLESSW
jgi:5'(3')-deoxyribonucleotidase